MDQEKLRGRLAELHRELEQGPEVDEQTRELLGAVIDDIRGLLDRPARDRPTDASDEHASLGDRLRSATWHLEESHPNLTTAVGDLVAALSRPFQ